MSGKKSQVKMLRPEFAEQLVPSGIENTSEGNLVHVVELVDISSQTCWPLDVQILVNNFIIRLLIYLHGTSQVLGVVQTARAAGNSSSSGIPGDEKVTTSTTLLSSSRIDRIMSRV